MRLKLKGASLPRKAKRSNAPRSGQRGENANLPLQVAYTQRQTAVRKIHTFTFSDMLTTVSVAPTTAIGQTWQFPVNPLTMVGTRLTNLARNFGKFRFKNIMLSVGVNMPVTVAGTYILGYCENPDQAFSSGQAALQQAFTLTGAVNKPWWQRGDCRASVYDKSKWYNIDADSSEVMNTTQGKFVLVNLSPPTTVGNTNVPMFVSYTIEMTENAIQVGGNFGPAQIWPAGTYTSAGTQGTYTFVAGASEPAIPALSLNDAYIMTPPSILIAPDTGEEILVSYISLLLTLPNKYVFYKTLEDFEELNYIKFPVGDIQTLVRTTVEKN